MSPACLARPLSRLVVIAAAAAAGAGAAHADWRPAGGFVQAGIAEHDTATVAVGVFWPWSWRRAAWGGEFSGSTEAFVSHWRSLDVGGRRSHSTVAAVVPLLRYRPDAGRSPWFVEGGIGLSLGDQRYRTPFKEFSTRWNFYDVLAVGRDLGQGRELSLRVAHLSNGSARQPNPGENLLIVRYAARF